MKKLAVLTNELPPYRRPIFNKLGRQEGLDVTIYLNTRAEPHRMWSPVGELPHVEIETVPGFAISSPQPYSERVVYIPIGVLSALFRKRPDAVISGEFGFRTLMAWAYCALFRKPLIIWQGETEHSAASISNLQRRARQFLARRAAGFLAYGQAARRYLHSLNVDDHKISVLTQSVDNDYWIQAAARIPPQSAGRITLPDASRYSSAICTRVKARITSLTPGPRCLPHSRPRTLCCSSATAASANALKHRSLV